MIKRNAEAKIKEMAQRYPVLALTGPRQSGKTTICKMVFSDYRYVSLENPDMRSFAETDPKGFLAEYDKYVIIDEVQNVPELFSYIQQIVDESNIVGHYILSGSQNFLLLEKITQSLAGRVYIMELLPLCHNEIKTTKEMTVFEEIATGSYPGIYDKKISPQDFYKSYVQTYVERDVRTILNIHNLTLFRKFIVLLAHNVGQLFNANNLSKQLGVDIKTIKHWFTILEASYIAFSLSPWYKNLSKRIIKSQKIYFYDTGLVCYLLGIENAENIQLSTYKGAIFENYGLLEILKNYKNKGDSQFFYFWRDSNGNEIDLLIEKGKKVSCIEFKASETVKTDFIKSLHYLDELDKNIEFTHFLFNTQDTSQKRTNETIVSWKDADKIN